MSDLMDDLAAAFDEHDDDDETPSQETEEVVAETTETEEVEETTDETPEIEAKETEVDDPEHAAEVEAAKEPEYKIDKAPASWNPKAREAWAKIPDDAKTQVAKREAEVNGVLQNSATARKAMDSFNNTINPFKQGLMAAGYQDPFTAINDLLTTEQTLRQGTVEGKAQLVGRLIKDFGVDIQTLDGILSGQPAQPGSANPQLEDIINQRMAPINAFLAQQEENHQYQQRETQNQADQAVATFGQDKEFLNDVRMDMADMMDMAAKRGQSMTLDQAYDKACAIHPEISGVIAQRAQTEQTLGSTATMDAKRTAAGASLTGTRAGGGSSTENMSLRGVIEDAWNG
jgi:hypothetical protein